MIAGAGFSLVDRLAVAYLALPVALFFALWFRPLVGLPLALAALAGLPALVRGAGAGRPSGRAVLAAVPVSVLWGALAGPGHIFYANHFDWVIRDATLRDLVVHPAPVAYADGAVTAILRAPLAYYIVPALVGKAAGLRAADCALYLWTVVGVALFLLQLFATERGWTKLGLIALVVVLSSGLDVLGAPRSLFDLTAYRGWWAVYYQYPSMTANLFWAPNHAVPAWLAIALVVRGRDDRRFVGLSAWLGTLTLLWSPLVSVGMLPFFGLVFWRRLRRGELAQFLSLPNLAAVPVAVLSWIYLTAGAGAIVSGRPPIPDFLTGAVTYGEFVVLEFLAMALVLWRRHRAGIDPDFMVVAIVLLLIFPLFDFGPGNDLAARSSAPALVVILIALIDGWARQGRRGAGTDWVFVLLCIGALTPVAEISRAVAWTAWSPDPDRSVYDIGAGEAPNYLIRPTASPLLDRLLRRPVPLEDCRADAGDRPATGTVLQRAGTGPDAVVLANDLDRDAVVKLLATDFRSILTVYLRAHETAAVANVPGGGFLVDYSVGGRFSPSCRMFLADMSSRLFVRLVPVPGPGGTPARIVLAPPGRQTEDDRSAPIAREFSLFS